MAKEKKKISRHDALTSEMHSLVDALASVPIEAASREQRRVRQQIDQLAERLKEVAASLDPVLRPLSIFDPADPVTAGRIIALTLVAQSRHSLANLPSFYGAGVYAIYYKGSFAPYSKLSGFEHPIYVGKADPEDSSAKNAVHQGTKLADRLREHARTIQKATSTLDLKDFECRFLIVQTGYQKSAESYLIDFFKPIWNSEVRVCFGMSKHGDAASTRANDRSPWHTLHPGVAWADATLKDQKSAPQIVRDISAHFESYPPYIDVSQIFERFIKDMRQLELEKFSVKDGAAASLEELMEEQGVDSADSLKLPNVGMQRK